ncbi:zinc finger FYVE domain-containing protein 9 [Parasteatoda tepidariorum]|uniref:zinc finger FYVE domain-containing protein 9 n=1 Tax=Parasteatoda tepidariorum TaxID=114398 RepID=UPI001C72427B|nr:zinc finger FYVE domain-containing protein 9 [Parasteatoda tepidariorum]
MEKYAIDIDKVLDEFEENEALETNIIKSVVSSTRENLKNYNEISQSVEKSHAISRTDDALLPFSINSDSCFDNQLSQISDDCIDKQNKNLKFLLDSSTLSNSNVGEPLEDKTLELCYNCTSNDKEDVSNFAYNKDSKLLNFDIFYKPVDSSNFSNHVISTDSYPSIVNSVACVENECNLEDEVLCVSVEEISPKLNNISQPEFEQSEFTVTNITHRSESKMLAESVKINDLNDRSYSLNSESRQNIMQSELEVEKCFASDMFLECSEKDYFSSNSKEPEGSIETAVQEISLNSKEETLEMNKENSQSEVTSKFMTQLSVNDSLECSSSTPFITSNGNLEENIIKAENDISEPKISIVTDSFECLADITSMNESMSSLMNDEKVKVEILKEDECVPNCSDMSEAIDKNVIPTGHSASNILSDLNLVNQSCDSHTESFVQDYLVPVTKFDEKESLMSGEQKDLEEAVSLKDTSYVPKTEPWKMCEIEHVYDSPNISQDDDSGVSSQEDISGNSPSEVPDNQSSSSSNAVQFGCNQTVLSDNESIKNCQDKTSLKGSVSSLQNNKCEENKSFDLNEISHIPSNGTLNSEEEISFTGARPKMDLPVLNNVNEEKFSSEDALSACDGPTVDNDVLNQGIINELEISISACLENELDLVSQSIILESNSVSSDALVQKEDDVDLEENIALKTDSDIKVDELSLRLQRPTSLNLPSLQLSAAEVIVEEDLCLDHENSDQLVENGSPVTPIDELTSEVPCVKQQQQIGFIRPYWIPDSEAANCMHCAMKFTVIRRRHHCRACGKVLCSRCCNQRAHLAYMNKEDRICQPCAEILTSGYNNMVVQNDQIPVSPDSVSNSSGSSPNLTDLVQTSSKPGDKTIWRPHPNNPDDYCSTIPPLQQMELSGPNPPPTVMVPIGVLKRGNKRRREPKQVIFSDGIRPGGDLTDLTEPLETVPVYRRSGRKRMDKIVSDDSIEADSPSLKAQQKSSQKRFLVSDGEGTLPPIVLQLGHEKDENVNWNYVFQLMQDEEQKAVKFILLKNLHILVKLTKLDCCYGKECWCFTSCGFCSVGQDEVMIILERIPEETSIPRDIFKFFTLVYDNACKGTTVEDLGHVIFPEKILDSTDHRGFLFVRPTFQCLSKLTVPSAPYLIAILIHKWEVPWAKVFPLRLMLRLGAECRYYPCSLVSVRNRKPVFFEIGQTIMSVLADLRNYQFTLPVIPGVVVHMEEKKTCVNIPRNRYDKIMKVLKTNNVEHVLPLGSNFSTEADSHLVCMQKEEGEYQTQAINIENTVRKVTGASFIVFSGALKSSSGLSAKFSIVEDGLLIQIPQETIVSLHVALREMRDLTIECGQIGAAEPEEIVIVQWTRDDKKFNIGVRSPIDGKNFEGVSNLRIHTSTDYAGENYLIRWTEIFFIESEENVSSMQNEVADPCHMAETVAQSCCMALTPYLDQLAKTELTKIGLRITLDTERDKVGYDIGSCCKPLPSIYMNILDSSLIPVILRLSSSTQNEKLSFELIFHILLK